MSLHYWLDINSMFKLFSVMMWSWQVFIYVTFTVRFNIKVQVVLQLLGLYSMVCCWHKTVNVHSFTTSVDNCLFLWSSTCHQYYEFHYEFNFPEQCPLTIAKSSNDLALMWAWFGKPQPSVCSVFCNCPLCLIMVTGMTSLRQRHIKHLSRLLAG